MGNLKIRENNLINKVKTIDFNNTNQNLSFTNVDINNLEDYYHKTLINIRTNTPNAISQLRHILDEYVVKQFPENNNKYGIFDAINKLHQKDSTEYRILTVLRQYSNTSGTAHPKHKNTNKETLKLFLLARAYFMGNVNEYFYDFDNTFINNSNKNDVYPRITNKGSFIRNLKPKYSDIELQFFPIDEYEVYECIEKESYEDAIYGKYTYKAKKKNKFDYDYYYIRPFAKNTSIEYFERDNDVKPIIDREGNGNIIKSEKIETEEDNCCIFLAYNIKENTLTLDSLKGNVNKNEIIKIISDVSSGLIDLIGERISIHHRGIRPNCIFVDKDKNGYHGKIGCFETAKVEIENINNATVVSNVVEMSNKSMYCHSSIKRGISITDDEWEQYDVYSLTYILSEYINQSATYNKDYDYLYDEFNEEDADKLISILRSDSLNTIPSMHEFKLLLEDLLK